MDVLLSPLRLDDLELLIRKSVKQAFEEQPTNPVNNSIGNDLLDAEQAAAYLGIAMPTLYGLVSADKISSMKPGKKLYFSKEDLMSYIKSSRRRSKAEADAEVENHFTSKCSA